MTTVIHNVVSLTIAGLLVQLALVQLSLELIFEFLRSPRAALKRVFGHLSTHIRMCLSRHPDAGSCTLELISRNGYHGEAHTVTTKDGFLLTMHRVNCGQQLTANGKQLYKGAVILQHGLLQCSTVFVNNGRKSLAFLLADEGYDVWLANSRGNFYSRKHVSLSSKDQAFWDWSFHEMALYDLPAMVQYARAVTCVNTVTYIGHSQGAAIGLAALSTLPELNKQINLFVALNPGAYVKSFKSDLFSRLISLPTRKLAICMGTKEFMPMLGFVQQWLHATLYATFAYIMFLFIFGWEDSEWDKTRKPTLFSLTPAGTSVRTILHWFQLFQTREFQAFDYNGHKQTNLQAYGCEAPPRYSLEHITAPVMVFAGGRDQLVDAQKIYSRLGASQQRSYHFFEQYAHMDFMWGLNAPTDFFPLLRDAMLEATSQQQPLDANR